MDSLPRILQTCILTLLMLILTGPVSMLNAEISGQSNCRVRLASGSIDLVFSDESVLSTPKDFDGRNLKRLSATGGLALDLLREVREQFRLGLITSANLPRAFSLEQNTPNPFNPSTTIRFTVASMVGLTSVSLYVCNLRGQLVRTLVDQERIEGDHSVVWDGRDESGQPLPAGVYLYRFHAGEFVATRKMVLLK